MKKFRGFSLAEMMVVMLLITVVLAATAPMITKRVSRERSSSIFEKLRTNPNNAVEYVAGRGQRIFMDARNNGRVGIVDNGVGIPGNSVMLGYVTLSNPLMHDNLVGIGFGKTVYDQSIGIGNGGIAGYSAVSVGYNSQANGSNSVAVGDSTNAAGANAVAIGRAADASFPGAIALGYNAKANKDSVNGIAIGNGASVTRARTGYGPDGDNSIAIGTNASSKSRSSVVIGYNAKAYDSSHPDFTSYNQIAIGAGAEAKHNNSVAIGRNAKTEYDNTIVLGDSTSTVYIPGNLVVGKDTLLGWSCEETKMHGYDSTCGRLYTRPSRTGEDGIHMAVLRVNDWKGGEDAGFYMARDVKVGPFDYAGLKQLPYRGDYSDNNFYNAVTGWHGQGKDYNSHSWSDIRLKDVGEDYTAGLEELLNLKFYHYTFKADENKVPHVGVMAQDLQKVFPDAVKADEEGWLRIRWDEMFYAAINAIKQLNEKIVAVVADVTGIKELVQTNQKTIEAQAELISKQAEQIDELSKRVEALELKLNEVKE